MTAPDFIAHAVLDLVGCAVDLGRREAHTAQGTVVLTPRETELIAYLARTPGRLVSRDELAREVWQHAPGVFSRAPDFAIHRLRGKLDPDGRDPACLESVAGHGVRLVARTSPRRELRDDAARFVGRVAELEAIRAYMSAGAGLITLLGPGGVGKTRLSLRIAVEAAQADSRVWLCHLEDARSEDQLCSMVARTLTLPRRVGDPSAHIARCIAELGPVLLVLDNLEQVVGPARRLLAAWTRDAPEATLLATSRERIGVAGERVVEVEPLPLADAVELFRARVGQHGGELSPDDDSLVEQIVERLDRLPLAIELAAGRTGLLTLPELCVRLDDRFATVSSRSGDLPDRQATLWVAMQWSWDLLDDHQRSALGQLAVFRGGFTVAAAEAVVALPEGAPPVLDLLGDLRKRSLLRRFDVDGRTRLDLLVSIREHAERQHGPDPGLVERHAAWAATAGMALRQTYRAVGSPEAWRMLEAELENLEAVTDRAEQVAPELLARCVLAGHTCWFQLGPRQDLVDRLDRALAHRASLEPDILLQLMLARADTEVAWSGDQDKAVALCKRAAELAGELHDAEARAGALLTLASLMRNQGRFDDAWTVWGEASALLSDDRTSRTGLRAHLLRANLLAQQADRSEAMDCYKEALAIADTLGNAYYLATITFNYALLLAVAGRRVEQLHLAHRALVGLRRHGDRRFEAKAMLCVGEAHAALGDLDQAESVYRQTLAVLAHTGEPRVRADVRVSLGRLLLARPGRADEALDLLESAGRTFVGLRSERSARVAGAWRLLATLLLGGSTQTAAELSVQADVQASAAPDLAAFLAGAADLAKGEPAAEVLRLFGDRLDGEGGVAPGEHRRIAERLLERF